MTAKIYGTLKVCDENYEDGIGFGIVGQFRQNYLKYAK